MLAFALLAGVFVLPITNADGKVTASGVLLDRHTMLTVAHAVGEERTVVFGRCGSQDLVGEVSKRSSISDLALVRLFKPCDTVPVSELSTIEPNTGDELEVQGYPARELHTSNGKCGGYALFNTHRRLGIWMGLIVLVSVPPGSSGGGVYSQNHKLVGIVHGADANKPGKPGVAVPLRAISQFLASKE